MLTSKKPRRLVPVTPPYLTDADAGSYIGKSQSWMRQRRFRDIALAKMGKPPEGPAWIQVESSILYEVTALDAWIAEKRIERGQVEWRGKSKATALDGEASA
jgi:hypothetical protein